MSKSASYLELLRLPGFVLFFGGRIVSSLGDMLFTMATMWYVLQRTNSPMLTAIVPLIPMISYMLLAMPLATFADRMPKKATLILTDIFRSIVVIVIWILILFHRANLYWIYFANLILTVAGFLFTPAQQSVLPNVLPKPENQLMPANALLNAASQVIGLVGYAIGAAIVAVLHIPNSVMLDAISFLISGLSIIPISLPSLRADSKGGIKGFFLECSSGIQFVWSKKILRALVVFAGFTNLFGAPLAILTLVFSKSILHTGILGYGYLETSATLGGIVGTLLSGKVASRLRLRQWLIISLVFSGSGIFVMPLIPYIGISIVLLAMVNIALSLLNVPLVTAIQLLAPDDMRGKVMTGFGLLSGGISGPIGLMGGGWLMGRIGPAFTFIGVGIACVVSGLISIFIPVFRKNTELELGFKPDKT